MSTAPPAPDMDTTDSLPSADEDSLGTRAEIETLGPCKLKIQAEVPAEKVAELLDRNLRDLASSITLPGFRPGKVPKALVAKRYGKEVEKDLKEALLNDSFLEVVKERELKVVGEPKFGEVHFDTEAPFRYDVEVETQPDFELETYKGIEVERHEEPVTEEEIEAELLRLREAHATLVPVERSSATGEDWFHGSYRLVKDDELIETREGTVFRPVECEIEGLAIPDLAERVTSAPADEPLRFHVQIPEGSQVASDHVGSELTLELKIEDTKHVQLPEVDDEFAKNFQLESADELRKTVRENVEEQHRFAADQKLEGEVLDKIVASVDFDLPEGVIESQKRAQMVRRQFELVRLGKSKEEIEEELKNADRAADDEVVRREVKRFFVLEKIAEKEKVFATEDDIKTRILAMAQVYGRKPDEILEELRQSNRFDELRIDIRHGKVKKLLRKKARVTNEPEAEGSAGSAATDGPDTASAGESPSGKIESAPTGDSD